MVATVPVQHVSSATNFPSLVGETGNNFVFTLPNAVLAGNSIVLGISYPNGSTPTVTDNRNTWPGSPAVTADPGGGAMVAGIFVLPNAAAGVTSITVSFGGAVQPFQYICSEIPGIATTSPANGTASTGATPVNGAALATGSFTPGANAEGNLIWAYYALATPSPTAATNPTSFVPGGSFVLLDGDISGDGNVEFPHASQYFLQASPASINPTVTATGDTGNLYNCVAVALKVDSTKGVAPSGLRISKFIRFVDLNGATWLIQTPTVGNLRVITNTGGAISTITDSEGGTIGNGAWVNISNGATLTSVAYSVNKAANPNLTITIGIDAVRQGQINTLGWFDISGADAAPFDKSATKGSTGLNGASVFNDAPDISPTGGRRELVIAVGQLGQGPGLGFASGAPAGAIYDMIEYAGKTDSSTFDQADNLGHLFTSSSAAETWNWSITVIGSNSGDGLALAFFEGPQQQAGVAQSFGVIGMASNDW